MSGNPTVSNVVPMPHAAALATNPAQPPMPFPMWGGGGSLPWGPGCCPPGGMDALMKCYCDVQAATAFICSVMVQCVQTNPAVVQAIIAAIEASGSTLPLLGVTNGAPAQPGQVGEFVSFASPLLAIPTAASSQSVSMGVLQPGDWDCWAYTYETANVHDLSVGLGVTTPGFSGDMFATIGSAGELVTVISPTEQALISVPTLIVLNLNANQSGAGPAASSTQMVFHARRRR